ncbi:MAG: imidazoleglycerol-phosphate dehydratase HisB [Candidatus Gastranaerophilaceae bacterium]|jgi:imidazoleglycerol-phosphate dehydratase
MRTAIVERKTLETEINVKLNIDGEGKKKINTGIRFFDHMLEQFAAHGYFDLEIQVNSIDKDPHHIVEDVSITLGNAFKKALEDKKGINRYGHTLIPMDEALTLTSIDLSGRPHCNFDVVIHEDKVSDFDTILVKHFLNSFAVASLSTIHIKLMYGEDTHHIIESIFKSFARALNIACAINTKHNDTTPSTKGIL